MFIFLSKLIPQFLYPLGLVFFLLLFALVLNRKPGYTKTILITALVILWLGANNWVSDALIRSLEWQYLPPATLPDVDVLVVLGGGTHSAQSPRSIVEVNSAGDRVIYAGWLYHQGVADRVLLTGGYITWLETRTAPANDMAALLAMLGVPADAMWLETQSQNTYENALFSKTILDEAGITQIGLVTSALHMPRAVKIFEKQGFEVIPLPADYTITQESWARTFTPDFVTQFFNLVPSASNLNSTTNALKEYLGIFVYRLKGWL